MDRPRSNSFHYTFEMPVGVLPAEQPALCPVRRTVSRWDPARSLFLRRGARVGAYRTDTGDFTDAEIARVKHGLGQVYLDVSSKPFPDDFARDLVLLRRSAVCDGCPERGACPGLFDPSPGDVFTRDDAPVRAMLAALTGDVLDVGCGHAPYADAMAPGVASGALRYTGLDPDPAAIAALGARWPRATLSVGGAEDLTAAARFDHALVLRSWNHLRDPVAASAALARALRPGGTLLVVDNVAFGLVRSRRHAQAAEGGPGVFEHFRNDGPDEALAHITRGAPGLALVARRDIAPGTSNQWSLVLSAPAAHELP